MPLIEKICLGFCLCCLSQLLQAQDSLEPVDDAASAISAILGGNKALTDVRLIADIETSATLEVDYKGFEGKYKVKAFMLNKLKKPVADIVCEQQTLAKASGKVELKFQFKKGSGNYTNNLLETHFVSIVFSKSDGILSGIDIGGQDILGETYVYKMNKKWRVGGSEAMVIMVTLTPFKSATSIQP